MGHAGSGGGIEWLLIIPPHMHLCLWLKQVKEVFSLFTTYAVVVVGLVVMGLGMFSSMFAAACTHDVDCVERITCYKHYLIE